jgi:hypothetical protein
VSHRRAEHTSPTSPAGAHRRRWTIAVCGACGGRVLLEMDSSSTAAALGDDVGRRDQHPTGWHDDTHPRRTDCSYLNSVRALRFGSLRSDDDCSRVAELLAELSS